MRLIDADTLVTKCGDYYVEEGPEDGFIGTLKTLIDMQHTIGEWVSVEDKLPDKCGNYLVYFGKGDGIKMKTAFWLTGKRIWKGAEAYSTLNGITHWMPLPEPPKEVK